MKVASEQGEKAAAAELQEKLMKRPSFDRKTESIY
jgi:hypothetical protein